MAKPDAMFDLEWRPVPSPEGAASDEAGAETASGAASDLEHSHRHVRLAAFARSAAASVAKAGLTLLRAAGNIAYPPSCVACGRIAEAKGAMCASCWATVRFIEKPYCAVYGTPFTTPLGEGALSARAIADPPPFGRARAAVSYEGPVVPLVHGFKFADRLDHGPWMALWMARAAAELLSACDVIVPVPLHWWRRVARRYNQSAVLAQRLAMLSGKQFAPQALMRIKATGSQRGLSEQMRRDNMAGAFSVPDAARIAIAGRRVLLVDDVITTAATVAAAARALKKAGAAEVDVAAFAMTLKQGADA
jgi:ComF family protein